MVVAGVVKVDIKKGENGWMQDVLVYITPTDWVWKSGLCKFRSLPSSEGSTQFNLLARKGGERERQNIKSRNSI